MSDGDFLQFVDDNGDVRIAGYLQDDGATVGDVLTVQSDGSIAAAAGGGGTPPNSWVADSSQSSPTLTTDPTPVAFDFPFDSQQGSDVSLSEDGLTFTIETDGVYSISVSAAFHLAADTAGVALHYVTTGDLSGVLVAGGPLPSKVLLDGSVSTDSIGDVYTLPSVLLSAGDTFQVVAAIASASGTAPTYSAEILVSRIA